MKNAWAAFVTGVLFAIGLGFAGMLNPANIFGFLDFFGNWNPALLFVMCGAISVHFFTYRFVRKKNKTPILDSEWHVPTKTKVTPALILGSILFGFGWAIGGMCPGPALAALASFQIQPIVFIIAMLAGMFLFNQLDRKIKLEK